MVTFVRVANWVVLFFSSLLFLIFATTFLVKAFNGVLLDVELQKVMYLSLVSVLFTGSNLYVINKQG